MTSRDNPHNAFTLLETLLALALLLLLTAMGVTSFATMSDSNRLDEAAARFTTALHMAGVDAAYRGRRIRFSFDAEDGRAKVQWEARPLAEPGRFTSYTAATWSRYVDRGLARIQQCVVFDADAVSPPAIVRQHLDAITFYPDGSSDSAVIVLTSADARINRHAVITLNGRLATTTIRFP